MFVWLKRLAVPLLLALVAIQILQPAKANPAIDPVLPQLELEKAFLR